MTRTILMTPRNDISIGADGSVQIVSGIAAVGSDCRAAMQTQRGELQYAATRGIPSLALVWNNYLPAQFEAAARLEIRQVPGVLGVVSLAVERRPGVVRYTAVIRTLYGEANANGSI